MIRDAGRRTVNIDTNRDKKYPSRSNKLAREIAIDQRRKMQKIERRKRDVESNLRDDFAMNEKRFWCVEIPVGSRERYRRGERMGLPGNRSKASNRETDCDSARRRTDGSCSSVSSRNTRGLIVIVGSFGIHVLKSYFGIIYKCGSRVMGMFKWLRKDFVQWDRSRRSLPSPDRNTLNNEDRKATLKVYFRRRGASSRSSHGYNRSHSNVTEENRGKDGKNNSNRRECKQYRPVFVSCTTEDRANSEAYRNALQAFLERRRESDDSKSPKFSQINNRVEFSKKNNTEVESSEERVVPGVPHVRASEVFEVGWVAGTEDRYLELISGEWQHTRISLRRSSHPECFEALKADLEILTQIRHPNTLLLMGTTRTDEHGLVAIFEPVDCTLYNFIHEQGERVSIQGAARCAGQLADALRHAHARGIIHGALSSHCVHLAASGIAKLGNWELAVRENEEKPYRDWEERLRSEIFRWQPPEIFYGDQPTKASDVYALTLIIWEMCTAQIPWSGLNQVEVERQYVHWERGITTESYNFPPLLNNLIEAGLRLDVNKRKLDMNRMRRFLQRLDLHYEKEAPFYIGRQSNNNNPGTKTLNAPVLTSTVSQSLVTPKRSPEEIVQVTTEKKLYDPDNILSSHIVQSASPKKINSNKNDLFITNEKRNDFDKNINVDLDSCKNNETPKNSNLEVDTDLASKEILEYKKTQMNADNKAMKIVDYDTSSSNVSVTTHSPAWSDDETASDTITEIKKLKQLLAQKREHFFLGNNSSINEDKSNVVDSVPVSDIPHLSPRSREKILSEARNQQCEPRKPASHKIDLEPRLGKSPTAFDPTLIKGATREDAKLLRKSESNQKRNADELKPSNFFESTLWRREKLICLSKMYKDSMASDNNDRTPVNSIGSPGSNSTYIINGEAPAGEKSAKGEDSAIGTDATALETELTENCMSQSKSLQALKEALDRATSIVRSATSLGLDSQQLQAVHSNISDFIGGVSQLNGLVFECLNHSKSGNIDSNDEIKSIERSTKDNTDALFVIEKPQNSPEKPQDSPEKPKTVSFGVQSTDFICGSNNNEVSQSVKEAIRIQLNSENERLISDFEPETEVCHEIDDKNESVSHLVEQSLISTATIFLSDRNQEKRCRTCQHKNLLARRQSLPAGLERSRSFNTSSPLGKLPIRSAEQQDPTVEDLYIDDEFGDHLNVNMLLMDGVGGTDEDDLLPSLLETSIA